MFGLVSASILTASVVWVALLAFYPAAASGFYLQRGQGKRPSPVILVPGDGGSQLEAKLDKPSKVHPYCDRKTEQYFNLWLNPGLLFPGVVDCWVDNMRLIYNHTTRRTENSPGVDIRVPGFGNTTSVEWLDPSGMLPPFVARFILSAYFVDIADTLTKMGYQRGVDIKGAPYDYRKAPNEMEDYYRALKDMTEETYYHNNCTEVTFICHIMGCPITAYFLHQQTQAWKGKYVKSLVTLAGAFGGAVKALKVIASGENLGIMIVSQTKLRTEQRTSPSLAYMLPSRLAWPKNHTLAMTKNRNYTVSDYEHFFRDTNFTLGYEMYKDTLPYGEAGLQPLGVEVHCVHGTGIDTPEIIDFRKAKNFPDDYTLIRGDGDGTVNTFSLRACLQWEGKQREKVYHLPMPGVEHMDILANKDVLNYVEYVVSNWN